VEHFYEIIDKSEDLTDNLDELANFLQEFTGATGVYIGKLVHPRKEITDDDDEKAHIDEENPKVINFLYSSKGHEFMTGKILKSDQGISHDVFKEQSVVDDGAADAGEGEEGSEVKSKVDNTDIL
jgi:hypothetical protein